MNFNEIGLKDLVLDFDSNDLQDITIVQGDTKTRGFKVLVSTNNGEIIKASSQYEMRLYGVNSNYPDKSFFTKATIDGDFYKVYISTDMASKSGKLQLQLALFEGTNALIQSRIKEVDVYASIANGGNVGKDLVVDFGKLENALNRADEQSKKFEESLVRQQAVESQIAEKHTEVVQIRDGLKDVLTTENARVEAEKKRVSAENTRASQENTRQSNETTRQSNESARQQNESTRQSNETQRQAEESTRKSDEQKRISAETNRNSEETKRDNSEKIRIENENKRISAENKRSENDVTYNKNEEERQSQESTRQSQEQQRVDVERQRQSQEDTRKQSEDTRNSQESTRQTQEQSRVDAESKRATSETSREQSEQTRNTNEIERQNAEKIRQSSEETRVSHEDSRVEAEKQRAAAESDRAGKFAGWDKTMQGVIPTATSTVAGIVRIDVDGESVAVSKKTFNNSIENLKSDVEKNKSEITTIDNNTKENKKHLEFLYGALTAEGDENAKEDAIENNIIKFLNAYDLSEDNRRIINNLEDTVKNEKADKIHKHTTSDITDLQTMLDGKAEKKYVDEKIKDVENSADLAFDNAEELKLASDYLLEWRNFEFLPAGRPKTEKPTLKYKGGIFDKIFTLKSCDNKLHYVDLNDFDKRVDFLLLRLEKGEYELVKDMVFIFADIHDRQIEGEDTISAINSLGLRFARCREVKSEHTEDDTTYTFEVEFIDELEIKEEGYDKADKTHTHKIADVEGLENKLAEKASNNDLSNVQQNVDKKANKDDIDNLNGKLGKLYTAFENRLVGKADRGDLRDKVSSNTVENIVIIEKGASTTNIPANSLIFEKE